MTAKQLSDIILLSCKKAVREEMKTFKQEILSEMRKSNVEPQRQGSTNKLVEQQKTFRQNYQVQPKRSNGPMSRNPLLNELLSQTQPVPSEGSSYLDMYESNDEVLNVPTNEQGQPIQNLNSPALASVVEAMNRNYSHLNIKKVTNAQDQQNFRKSVMSKMMSEESISENYDSEIDEDLSWMKELS